MEVRQCQVLWVVTEGSRAMGVIRAQMLEAEEGEEEDLRVVADVAAAEEVAVGATADTTMDTADGTTIGGEVISGHAPIAVSALVCM